MVGRLELDAWLRCRRGSLKGLRFRDLLLWLPLTGCGLLVREGHPLALLKRHPHAGALHAGERRQVALGLVKDVEHRVEAGRDGCGPIDQLRFHLHHALPLLERSVADTELDAFGVAARRYVNAPLYRSQLFLSSADDLLQRAEDISQTIGSPPPLDALPRCPLIADRPAWSRARKQRGEVFEILELLTDPSLVGIDFHRPAIVQGPSVVMTSRFSTVSRMEASRPQPGMLQGLSRFLVQHERCGAGFDVAHPAGLGSGRVSITCRGCGARHEYATATIEVEREVTFEPAGPRVRRRPALDEPGEAVPPARDAAQIPAPAGEAAPRFRRSPGAVLALTALAAAALTFALVTIIGGGGGTESARVPSRLSSTPPPTPVPRTRFGAQVPPPTKTIRTERFTIEAPLSWTERTSTGGILLRPRNGSRVEVQVYFERSPGLTLSQMARQTAAFLRRQVPGARVFPQRTRVAGWPASQLTARGPGETAIARDIAAGSYRYLLVRRIFAGAKPASSEAAALVERSFRPR
jgi:hypothetical protein